MKPFRTPRGTITNPSPQEIARYLGHRVVLVLRDEADSPDYCVGGRIVVVSASGIILRDTTDYTETFSAYSQITGICAEPVR